MNLLKTGYMFLTNQGQLAKLKVYLESENIKEAPTSLTYRNN